MEMETLCPPSYFPNFSFLVQERKYAKWTKEENKKFERALAIYDEETPDRWLKVAAMIPGKSISDVERQYMELEADVCDIEAGLVPIPGYLTSSFTLEMVDNYGFDRFRKRPLTGRSDDHERKKGVPWTEDEHRQILSLSLSVTFQFHLVIFMFGYVGNCFLVCNKCTSKKDGLI